MTVDAGFHVKIIRGVDSSLKNIGDINSCKFMYSPDSEEVEVAFSGYGSDKTHIFDVTQYIKKPIKLDTFQKGSQS